MTGRVVRTGRVVGTGPAVDRAGGAGGHWARIRET